jgi:hypothetical protein
VVLSLSPHDAFGNPTVLDPQALQVDVFPPCNCLVSYSSGNRTLMLRWVWRFVWVGVAVLHQGMRDGTHCFPWCRLCEHR